MPLERKTPVAYPDGVYEIAGGERGNVLLISNVSQNGLTGLFSTQRTALFTFFGKLGHRAEKCGARAGREVAAKTFSFSLLI